MIAHFLSESRIRSLIWQKTRDSLRNSMSEFPTLVPFHPPHRFSFFTQVFDHFLHITVTSILNHPLYILYYIIILLYYIISISKLLLHYFGLCELTDRGFGRKQGSTPIPLAFDCYAKCKMQNLKTG